MDSSKETITGRLRFQVRGHESDPATSALPLRLMGSVNRLVLEGRESALADHYGGKAPANANDAWEAFRIVLERNEEELRQLVELPVQTNE